jgi:hypothetical protein
MTELVTWDRKTKFAESFRCSSDKTIITEKVV